MALNWVRSLIVQCFCRRPNNFLKDKGSGYYGESQDDLYDSDGFWDEKVFVNNMGPEIASSFETIPQIVLIESNPAFEDDSESVTNSCVKKFLTVPEKRYL